MDTNETCEVLPLGFHAGDLKPAQVHTLALSGVIPAEYVRERAAATLGVAFLVGAMLTGPTWYLTTWVLTLHR